MYKAENEDELISAVKEAKQKNVQTFGLLLQRKISLTGLNDS